MPDDGPSDRAQTVYVIVFCALAGIVYMVQREVGHAKFQHHPAWTHPFTVPGTFSMLLTRGFFEGTHLQRLSLLPFGLFTQVCLWFPLLLGDRGRLGWLRRLIVQLVWGGVWVAISLWLCREAYRFYA
jgi:hypothetical protein